MKLGLIVAGLLLLAGPSFAQQAQSNDPKTEATERMLLDEMTAHRNWYATAIAKDTALQQTQKQLADAQSQVAALQKQLDASASAKALPAPAPASTPEK